MAEWQYNKYEDTYRIGIKNRQVELDTHYIGGAIKVFGGEGLAKTDIVYSAVYSATSGLIQNEKGDFKELTNLKDDLLKAEGNRRACSRLIAILTAVEESHTTPSDKN